MWGEESVRTVRWRRGSASSSGVSRNTHLLVGEDILKVDLGSIPRSSLEPTEFLSPTSFRLREKTLFNTGHWAGAPEELHRRPSEEREANNTNTVRALLRWVLMCVPLMKDFKL